MEGPFQDAVNIVDSKTVTDSSLINTKVADLEQRLKHTSLKLYDLATVGTLVTSILQIESVLSVVMELAIRMVEGEVGVIQLQEEGELISKITWGVDDTLVKSIIHENGLDVSTYVYQNRKPVCISRYDHNLEHGPNINSVLAVPIASRSHCHGTIVIVNKTSGEEFTDEDQADLEMLMNFAAVAIDNSILLNESLQKQKMEQELAIARQIQSTILPDPGISIEGVEIGTLYIPAREVGGDFYDIIKLDDNQFVMVIGDVTNKGVPAALVMTATSAIIRSQLQFAPQITPSQLMEHLNNVLCESVIKDNDMFATLFIARFDLSARKIAYCNAGHLPPLYWNTPDNAVQELKTGGTFVGQFAGIQYQQDVLDINRGDKLFCFTDGLTEAEDRNGEIFGTKRTHQVFVAEKDLPGRMFCDRVKEWIDRYSEGGSEESVDDFTIMKITIAPERP